MHINDGLYLKVIDTVLGSQELGSIQCFRIKGSKKTAVLKKRENVAVNHTKLIDINGRIGRGFHSANELAVFNSFFSRMNIIRIPSITFEFHGSL